MPRPVDRHTVYRPGLDGVRALAVGLVICYHLGIPGFGGGLLGVGIFFTLSGYLITGLLIAGKTRRGGWGLSTFWLRRARRLLPAVIMVLACCLVVVAITDPSNLARRAVQAVAALFYVANWHTIATGDSYFAQVHGTGPFDHLWSLSVEEQFYLIWPLLLGLIFALARGRVRLVAATTAVLAAASFTLLSLLAHAGVDNTRAYEGTDSRAGGLLIGAALVMTCAARTAGAGRARRARRVLLDLVGVAGLVGIAWMVTRTNENTLSTYRWGLLLLSTATAGLLAAVAAPDTLLAKIFGIAPLRWVGERSYGLYLWHLPVIVFTPTDVLAAHTGVRDLIQVTIAVTLAAASWHFIEDPIRTHGLRGAWRAATHTIRQAPTAPTTSRPTTALVLGACAFAPIAVLALLAPHVLPHTPRNQIAASPPSPVAAPSQQPSSGPSDSPSPASTHTPPRTGPARTSCTSVILVGDSTSEGLVGETSWLSPRRNITGQLRDVGVQHLTAEISGARSIIETYDGQLSGEHVISKHVAAGYHGCWIISLGNVDAATVKKYAPNTMSIPERIDTVMHTIPANQPVLWLTTRTILRTGNFPASAYPPWNNGLVAACSRYPNMRVFDWAATYRTSWFGPDGIHSTTTGYQHKAHLIAHAIAAAFPQTGTPTSTCVTTK